MEKILSIIMAIVMLVVSSFVPGFVMPGTETMTVNEWLAEVNEAFNLNVLQGITGSSDLEIAETWGVIVDYEPENLDLEAPVAADFVATTLVNAANLEATAEELLAVTIRNSSELPTYEKVAVAVARGVIETNAIGMVPTYAMDKADAMEALKVAVDLWENRGFDGEEYAIDYVDGVKEIDADFTADGNVLTFAEETDLVAGDVFVAGNEAFVADVVEGNTVTTSEADAKEVIETVDYEGSFSPVLQTAAITDGNGEVISEGADFTGVDGFDLKKEINEILRDANLIQSLANISFSVGGFKVKVKVTGTDSLYISIGKSLGNGHVNVLKEYELSDLKINAKFDADIKALKFNEVYLTSTYDLVDTTTFSGSYTASLVERELGEGADAVTFLDRVKGGLFDVAEGETQIDIAKFDIPIGNTSLTIGLNFSLVIGVDGYIKFIVTSENQTGIEIINNKARIIYEEEVLDNQIDAYGNFSICLGFGIGLGILGYEIVDARVIGGIGAEVFATLKFVDANGEVISEATENVAIDAVSAAVVDSDLDIDVDLRGEVRLYGILRVELGKDSLLGEIGLDQSWTFYDRGIEEAYFMVYSFEA
jgi:hypothetical protein